MLWDFLLWSKNHFALLTILEMSTKKRASPQKIKMFCVVTVVLCMKQLRFYAWLQLTDVGRVPAVVAIKSLQ